MGRNLDREDAQVVEDVVAGASRLSAELGKSRIEQIIDEMWCLENAMDDADGIQFDAASDMWWVVSVFCPHVGYDIAPTRCNGTSHGAVDLTAAFEDLLINFKKFHETEGK